MNKFDKLYEEVMNNRVDEGMITDIWNKLHLKSFDRIIMYDFILLIGNLSSTDFEKHKLLKGIIRKLKTYPKLVDKLIHFYQEKDNVKINRANIFRVLIELENNSQKRFEIHKEVRDEKANEHIQKQLQRILSI